MMILLSIMFTSQTFVFVFQSCCVAAAGSASVLLMLQRAADLISLDGSLLYAGCCHIISHVGGGWKLTGSSNTGTVIAVSTIFSPVMLRSLFHSK